MGDLPGGVFSLSYPTPYTRWSSNFTSLRTHQFQGDTHREWHISFERCPLSSQFVPERRLLRERDRRKWRHFFSGPPTGREHVVVSGDGVHAVDNPTGHLPTATRRHADLSKLAVSRRRTQSHYNSTRQPEFQFSTQMD